MTTLSRCVIRGDTCGKIGRLERIQQESMIYIEEGSRLMNELSIAHGLLKDIQQESKKHGVAHVSRVHIRIGSLRDIVPEDLTFAFEAAAEGTVAEGAELNIGVVPARGRCDKCNIYFDVDPDTPKFLCPKCGASAEKLVSGKELEIALFRGQV